MECSVCCTMYWFLGWLAPALYWVVTWCNVIIFVSHQQSSVIASLVQFLHTIDTCPEFKHSIFMPLLPSAEKDLEQLSPWWWRFPIILGPINIPVRKVLNPVHSNTITTILSLYLFDHPAESSSINEGESIQCTSV